MIRINDTDWTPDLIREHRKQIIELRDEALAQNDFEWAITLSLTVALLEELAKRADPPAAAGQPDNLTSLDM